MEVRAKVEAAAKRCGSLDRITISEREDGRLEVVKENGLTLVFLGQLDQQGLLGYVTSATTIVVWN
jgi:hypothetical protein